MQKQILGAQKVAEEQSKPLNDNVAKLEREIKSFVTDHRDEMGKTKSVVLTFGEMCIRDRCPLGQLYEDAEAQDLRIRERSERALREHIEGVRHAEDTLTALLGGHEALAYLAALRDGQILPENECEHYAAQIAEAGAAWELSLIHI